MRCFRVVGTCFRTLQATNLLYDSIYWHLCSVLFPIVQLINDQKIWPKGATTYTTQIKREKKRKKGRKLNILKYSKVSLITRVNSIAVFLLRFLFFRNKLDLPASVTTSDAFCSQWSTLKSKVLEESLANKFFITWSIPARKPAYVTERPWRRGSITRRMAARGAKFNYVRKTGWSGRHKRNGGGARTAPYCFVRTTTEGIFLSFFVYRFKSLLSRSTRLPTIHRYPRRTSTKHTETEFSNCFLWIVVVETRNLWTNNVIEQ